MRNSTPLWFMERDITTFENARRHCEQAKTLAQSFRPLARFQDEEPGLRRREAEGGGGLRTMTDILLRKAPAGRAGAQGDNDYDVIGTDGMVIGRIFETTTSPAGTPWMWTIAYGNHEANHEDRTPTHGYEATREAAMQAFGRSWYRET
jgi:hypothetical protein